MDGINGSTVFTDVKGHTFTRAGTNAAISTVASKFGGASLSFPVANENITSNSSSDFAFGTGDFTIEEWIQFSDYTLVQQGLFSTVQNAGGVGISISSSNGVFNVYIGSGAAGSNVLSGVASGIVDSSTFHHVAVTRAGTTLRLFIDGVQKGSTTDSSNLDRTIAGVGTFYTDTTGSATRGFTGYVDDLRITKGVARYTSNFTPPTAAFPNQ